MKQGKWKEDDLSGKGEGLYIHLAQEYEMGIVHL
jgi:hypothetical protein